MMPLMIIGEAGSCHEESLDRALQLTAVAAAEGCSAVKWQYWSDPLAMRARRHVELTGAYERGAIQPTWFPTLRDAAIRVGLQFMCTV
jgi:sialic acid synthase SpsE